MSKMVDLSTFVENRQQDNMSKKRRQVLGDRYRVPVPRARFDHAVSIPKDQKLTTRPSSSSRHTPEPEPLGRRETHGFDTDAESIGESTNMDIPSRMNSPSQVTKTNLVDKSIALPASAKSQHTRDIARGQYEESSPPDDESLAPSFDDGNSGENDYYHHRRSRGVHSDLFTETKTEEFIDFKKRNALNTSLFQVSHSSEDYAPIRPLTASSHTPVSAVEDIVPISSRSLSPAHENANFMSNQTSQYPKDDISKSAGYLNNATNRKNQATPSLLAVHDRLVEARCTDKHGEFTVEPMSLNTPIKLDHPHGMMKLISGPEQISTETQLLHQPSDRFADPSILGSESSSERGPEGKIGSGITQGTLKRKPSLDHSSDQLRDMEFQDLLKEPFDGISTPVTSLQSSRHVEPHLRATLEQISFDKTSQDYYFQHRYFFEKLSLGEYIECGEVIAEKLKETISNLCRIRQEKRGVVSKFEEEIVQREETVRSRVAGLKRKKGVMTRQTEELTAKRSDRMESKE